MSDKALTIFACGFIGFMCWNFGRDLFQHRDTPECSHFRYMWIEQSAFIDDAQKHRPVITIPAHWQEECTE